MRKDWLWAPEESPGGHFSDTAQGPEGAGGRLPHAPHRAVSFRARMLGKGSSARWGCWSQTGPVSQRLPAPEYLWFRVYKPGEGLWLPGSGCAWLGEQRMGWSPPAPAPAPPSTPVPSARGSQPARRGCSPGEADQ